MAFVLFTVALAIFFGAVDSTTNITSCTSSLNDQCRQNLTTCSHPPCAFSCGRKTPQFSCSQDCSPIPSANLTTGHLCSTLDCQASAYCDQICSRLNCDFTRCTSRDCRQRCVLADCGSMACRQSVTSCDQAALIPQNAQIMNCEAKSCNQICQRSSKTVSCDMTCLETVETCEQKGLTGKFQFKCSGGVKNCTQKANLYGIADMVCEAERCEQACSHSTCSMSCSTPAHECTQSEDGFGFEVVTMYCDANVCRQHCDDTKCNMTCSSAVKECYQTCKKGDCLVRCDAETCYGVKGISTSTPSRTWFNPTDGGSLTRGKFLPLCLVLISLDKRVFNWADRKHAIHARSAVDWKHSGHMKWNPNQSWLRGCFQGGRTILALRRSWRDHPCHVCKTWRLDDKQKVVLGPRARIFLALGRS